MARLTDDRNDPDLGHGANDGPVPQNDAYLVLSAIERSKGYVRPLLTSYIHARELGGCGALTTMSRPIAETYARQPGFYGATYCTGCSMHKNVGEHGEFYWVGTQHVSWENTGIVEESFQSVTENKLKVGT